MKKTLLSVFSAVALLATQSCKDDIEIFAQGEEVTVVYGLLNAKDSLQSIKINKVFQGQGTLEQLAQDPTNSEYANLDSAKLIEYELLGRDTFPTGRNWLLTEDIVTNKDSGYFYYPDQKIYRTAADLLTDRLYQIYIDKQDGSPIVSSYSQVIEPRTGTSTLTRPTGVNIERRGLSLSVQGDEPQEDPIQLEFSMPLNAKVMEVYIDLTYRNQAFDDSFGEPITISYKVGTLVTSRIPTRPTDDFRVEALLNATSFYTFIAGNVPEVKDGEDIKQRVLADVPLKFRYVIGGEELQTYLEVSEPSTSILETKPEYTNIKNGIGVFSCRSFEEMDGYLSLNSITYLVDGEICAGRKFCHSTSPGHIFYCYQ
jgi:hypothetical protein